jgi:hypothetical protein
MTDRHGAAIAAELHARGVISDPEPPPFMEVPHRPWFVSLLMGVAGWLAGMFLLSFIGFTFKPESQLTIFILGAAMLGGAWAMYNADRDAVFLDQLALAISIAGQMAVAWALLEDADSAFAISATLFVIQVAVLFVMPNRTARILAALFAMIAWVYTVRFALQSGDQEDVLFGMNRLPRTSAWSISISWLLTWGPLVFLAARLTATEHQWMAQSRRHRVRPVLTGGLLGLSLGGMATEPFLGLAFGVDTIGIDISWMAIFPLLSIGLAMFAAYCAYQLGSRGLVGFAAFGGLLHLSRFYYFFGTSLTWKALIMVSIGVLLVCVSLLLKARAEAEPAP